MKTKNLTARLRTKWVSYRDQTLPNAICYGMMALSIFVLHDYGSPTGKFSAFVAILGGVLSAAHFSFATERTNKEGKVPPLWDRISDIVSAFALMLLYLHFGFPEHLPGSAWLFSGAVAILIFIVSPLIKELNRSEQDGGGQPATQPRQAKD